MAEQPLNKLGHFEERRGSDVRLNKNYSKRRSTYRFLPKFN